MWRCLCRHMTSWPCFDVVRLTGLEPALLTKREPNGAVTLVKHRFPSLPVPFAHPARCKVKQRETLVAYNKTTFYTRKAKYILKHFGKCDIISDKGGEAMALEGFEIITFGNSGAYVSITKNGITFNKVALEKVNGASHVLLMVNRDMKQFAIKPCTPNDPSALPFTAQKPNTPNVRWNSKDLLRLFSGLMTWNLEKCNGFRVNGEYIKADKALLFDLRKAIPIE